jgi:predicted DNA-binding transcriptional regulator AlpA
VPHAAFTPSIEYLARCGTLMLDTKGVAEFLGVSRKQAARLADTGRIPRPCRLGLGSCFRWSVLRLLEWVEAGCPRR